MQKQTTLSGQKNSDGVNANTNKQQKIAEKHRMTFRSGIITTIRNGRDNGLVEIYTVSPEPSLLVHTKKRQKKAKANFRLLKLTEGCICMFNSFHAG